MPNRTYDIFSGRQLDDALWLEAVQGLEAAQNRMQQLAQLKPGPYFLFSPDSQVIVSTLDSNSLTGRASS